MKTTFRNLKNYIIETLLLSEASVPGGKVMGTQLTKGMKVAAQYNQYNQGTEYVEILGVSDTDEAYGDGGVKFDSVKAAMQSIGAKTLKHMEEIDDKNPAGYGHSHYLWCKDLKTGEEGAWFYLSSGRWSRGSGAERLSFTLLTDEEVRAAGVHGHTGTGAKVLTSPKDHSF